MHSNAFTLLCFTLLYFTVGPKACKRLGCQVRNLFEDPRFICMGEGLWQLKLVRNAIRKTPLVHPSAPAIQTDRQKWFRSLSHQYKNVVNYPLFSAEGPPTQTLTLTHQLFRSVDGITPTTVLSFEQVSGKGTWPRTQSKNCAFMFIPPERLKANNLSTLCFCISKHWSSLLFILVRSFLSCLG